MDMVRQVIVFDAADLHAESAFWAGILGGHVLKDNNWHSVIDAAGEWRIGVQLAPDHVPPDWPHGAATCSTGRSGLEDRSWGHLRQSRWGPVQVVVPICSVTGWRYGRRQAGRQPPIFTLMGWAWTRVPKS